MVVVRERAFLHLFYILPDSADGHFGQFGVTLGEFRLEIGEHAEQIVAQQDLPIAAGTGANADGRDRELLRYQRAILAGTASNSSMKQPASSIASASSRIFMAASAVRP